MRHPAAPHRPAANCCGIGRRCVCLMSQVLFAWRQGPSIDPAREAFLFHPGPKIRHTEFRHPPQPTVPSGKIQTRALGRLRASAHHPRARDMGRLAGCAESLETLRRRTNSTAPGSWACPGRGDLHFRRSDWVSMRGGRLPTIG
jgi:hypothetical protein